MWAVACAWRTSVVIVQLILLVWLIEKDLLGLFQPDKAQGVQGADMYSVFVSAAWSGSDEGTDYVHRGCRCMTHDHPCFSEVIVLAMTLSYASLHYSLLTLWDRATYTNTNTQGAATAWMHTDIWTEPFLHILISASCFHNFPVTPSVWDGCRTELTNVTNFPFLLNRSGIPQISRGGPRVDWVKPGTLCNNFLTFKIKLVRLHCNKKCFKDFLPKLTT